MNFIGRYCISLAPSSAALVCFRRVHGHGSAAQVAAAKDLLGLTSVSISDINQKELRYLYYRLAKSCHPDSAEPALKDPVRFNELAEAYALLSGRTAQSLSKPLYHHTRSANISSQSLWARLFYGSVQNDVMLSQSTLDEIQEAASLHQGGVDKEGLWELVREMSRSESAKDPRSVWYLPQTEVDVPGEPTAVSRRDRKCRKL